MSLSLARLDLTQIFCDVDDFYREFEQHCERDIARLPCDGQAKRYQSRLSISEVMTIVVAFHGSGYRTFKDFYKGKVLPDWREAFPDLVSYGRFVELMPWSFMGLVIFNLVSGLIAYAYHPDKPSLGIPNQELKALPQAAF